MFREGIKTAIIGRPNVGKSSLLNVLSGYERAIVTDIEGTTRDTIEEFVNVKGIPLKLIDTAGIRQTDEVVEQIGVKRSHQVMQEADLIILILNQAEKLTDTDKELLRLTQGSQRIIVLNKQDLPSQLNDEDLRPYSSEAEMIRTSMLSESGMNDLEQMIWQNLLAELLLART